MKTLISTRSFGEFDRKPLDKLKEAGFEIVPNPYGRSLEPEESIELLEGATGLIAGTEPLTEEVLSKAGSLKVISRCGTGMDNVDLEAAKRLGIKVLNTPDAPTLAVAELTLGLILALYRRIAESDRCIRSGRWKRQMGQLLYRKKLGIVGLGRIGKRLVELTTPFDLEVMTCEPSPDIEFVQRHNIQVLSFNELLKKADIVSLHLSCPKGTHCLIGRNELALMKPSAILINTSRGWMIDEEALYEALANKIIAGAALDVFENEPYDGNLRNLDNVILTTHIGSSAKETRIQMEIEAVDNLLRGLVKSITP
ncbi:phosphoglycerate dehydrogenase [bacterium]|nr:phosphoglycerate dehydrogenase [bacterium]MBU1616031.1 phosphoglycerate dehydrogenase [bacterium]